ncbi:helix-turn-helix transcriptional regulator [Streptomyces sp. NPDC087270]|uniref:helix-turn-helix transcriptional regulator n=1 Tax=Streptomyces sp. NPDC087270 TaxID=3365774 RepID=UPI0038164122
MAQPQARPDIRRQAHQAQAATPPRARTPAQAQAPAQTQAPAQAPAQAAAPPARVGGVKPQRRGELAAFLRSRRARISPEDVGMPPGSRRRTPGLRREEVAQLAGVGVTWYTWLEQGRPINASVQVLDAVARVLQLDVTERDHLYGLAGIPFVSEPVSDAEIVGEELLGVLGSLNPLPAAVYNARYDVQATNATYRVLWPMTALVERWERNVLYKLFTTPDCCSTFKNSAEELPWMVAQLRRSYARHIGESAWEDFVALLIKESATFAQLWASGNVAAPGRRVKVFRHAEVGIINLTSLSLSIDGMAEHRIVVYTPVEEEDRLQIERLRAIGDPIVGCERHGRRLSAALADSVGRTERARQTGPAV